MAEEKKDLSLSGIEDLLSYLESLSGFELPPYRELPPVRLYMEQVLEYVNNVLRPLGEGERQTITSFMVNNYVKQGVVPAPRKKRYTRRHLGSLLFVCAFKRVFSIAQVKQIMGRIYASGVDLEWLYDATCSLLERSLAACFSEESDPMVMRDPDPGLAVDAEKVLDPELRRMIEAAVASLATRVYVEQTLLLAEEGRAR